MLGKLSKKQIQSAFEVLSKLQKLLDGGNATRNQFIESTNKFYTFIPHAFGMDDPPIINNEEIVKVSVSEISGNELYFIVFHQYKISKV